jgi:hypothetical protein
VTRVLLSYAYPPFEAPRAVQVDRLARHLPPPVEVICGEVERISGLASEAVAGGGRPGSPRVRRVAWSLRARVRREINARLLRGRLDVPDRYRPWVRDATRVLLARRWLATDVLCSFGQPWSDHVAALHVARKRNVPWVAHFSDPWIRNPLSDVPTALLPLHRRLERAVLASADGVVFTNHETLELVMEPYPPAWRERVRVIPHSFEPRVHPQHASGGPRERVVARHLGAFYGRRSPGPLLVALGRLAREHPTALDGLSVELVGPCETPLAELPEMAQVPPGLVRVRSPVDYPTSLELMASSDLLLVVDAAAERSPFLPSKLVEYVGSGRPIVALSPPGPCADLVRRLGGWVAHPDSRDAPAALASALAFARTDPGEPWGDPDVRTAYRADRVAVAFEAVLADAVAARASATTG